jgi:hypothetical protein
MCGVRYLCLSCCDTASQRFDLSHSSNLYKNNRRFFFWIRVQHTLLLWAHLHVNTHALLSVKHHAHRITIRIPSPLRQWPKFKLTRRDVVPSLAQCNDEFYTIIKYLHKAASIMFEVTSQSQVCNI